MGESETPGSGGAGTGDDAVAREADRVAGDILDGKVPSADAPASAPPAPEAGSPGVDGEDYLSAWNTGLLVAQGSAVGEKPGPGAPQFVKREYGRAVAGVLTIGLVVFLAAIVALQGQGTGGGGSGNAAQPPVAMASGASSAIPSAPGPSAPGFSASMPSQVPSPASPALSASPAPSSAASPQASATLATAPTTSPVPQSITYRGPISTKAMSSTGLQIGQHDIELVVFLDNGSVTGSMVLVIEEFPIGALLTQVFDGQNDPDFATFKTCTTRLRLEGDVRGRYAAGTGKLKGKIKLKPVSEDVHSCLASRPKNVTIDSATKTSSIGWTGTLNGSKVKGRIETKPASPFTAVALD